MKSNQLSLSVVIPTYNRARWLREALGSVQAQTASAAEVIVIDDGSEDGTQDLVKAEFPEVHYLHQEQAGVSAARNRGIEHATSDWIALLDSDDLWQPEKLERQWAYLNEYPQLKILQTEEIWIRNGRRVNPRRIHQKPSGWIFDQCIPLCVVSPSAVMIHRDVFEQVGLFDEALPVCEDYDLWLRASLHFEIHTHADPLTIKRGGHADQLSRQWGLDRYRVQALEKLLERETLTSHQRHTVIADIQRRLKILAEGSEKRGKFDDASSYQQRLLAYQSL